MAGLPGAFSSCHDGTGGPGKRGKVQAVYHITGDKYNIQLLHLHNDMFFPGILFHLSYCM